jgi:cell wall-associated NlpC family hydrolase
VRNPRPRSPSLAALPRPSGRAWRLVAAALALVPFLAQAHPAAADPIGARQAQAARLARQIDQLSLQVSRLSEQYDAARLRVDQVNAKLAQAQAAVGATDGNLTAARLRVRAMAVSSYVSGGEISHIGLLVPKSVNELSERNAYVHTLAGGTSGAIDALRQARAQFNDEQVQLIAEQAAANRALASAETARRGAAAADAAERAVLDRVRGQLAGLVAALQAQQRAASAGRLQADIAARDASRASRSRSSGGLGGSGLGGGNSGSLPPPPPGAAGAVEEARRQLGKPYRYGGSGPDSFDCSGLTAWSWGHAGHSLPHSAAAQYNVTTHVPVSALQPGDLVFFGSPPYHVGIYVGGGQMINALHSGTNVEYDSIYGVGDLIGGGRVN